MAAPPAGGPPRRIVIPGPRPHDCFHVDDTLDATAMAVGPVKGKSRAPIHTDQNHIV